MLTSLFTLSWLAACGGGPDLQIEVVDVFANPVSTAVVAQEGRTERIEVDKNGFATVEVEPGNIRLTAGAEGYIKDATAIDVAEDAEGSKVKFTLFPIPKSAGFYGLGDRAYVKLVEAPVEVMATEMTTFHGIKDIPKAATLPNRDKDNRFVFQTSLREQELKRMDIKLSLLDFQEKAMVTGPLGEVEVEVELWTSKKDIDYRVKSMDAPDNYLLVAAFDLEPGVYAFHSQGILDATAADALAKLPKEMKVVYAFEIR
jgi:hypothetical protein